MEALENIFTRRSVRSFTDKEISKQNLETIVRAAVFAPTARNRQLWRFTVITDKAKIQKLARAIAVELERGEDYDFYNPTALIITSNERENPHGIEDCACALENIFLAANALSIGSVWINQLKGICDVPAIREVLDELSIPSDHLVYGMAALGYAAQPPKELERNSAAVCWVE